MVVFVGPEGARAASAGLFIAMAAHVAVMAPSTNIGAAHPVSLAGDQSGQSEVLESKVTNDAAAYIRGIAETRGRNADWAELAVRESVSITAREALDLGVIDLIATDVDDLLARIDGREVSVASNTKILRTEGLDYDTIELNAVDSFLHILVDPNIAFLLFSLGGAAMIAEIFNPGLIFPGVAGPISLILAFTAFGSLPVNWAGVGLIVLALALIALEGFVASNGVLGGGGGRGVNSLSGTRRHGSGVAGDPREQDFDRRRRRRDTGLSCAFGPNRGGCQAVCDAADSAPRQPGDDSKRLTAAWNGTGGG